MLNFLHLALRVLAGIVGATAIYAALFLYEDEQGKIENRLEEWWIRLDDQRNAAVSRHTAFVREVARLAGQGFDRLFGQKLFSLRAFSVSSALTVSMLFAFVMAGTEIWGKRLSVGEKSFMLWGPAAGAALSLACALSPALRRSTFWRLDRLIPLLPLLIVLALVVLVEDKSGLLGLLLSVIASFACDILFIAATRASLRWASNSRRFLMIAAAILLNGLLATTLILGPFGIMYFAPGGSDLGLGLAALANIPDAVVASVFAALALSMLAHRLFWPLINRPLYALREQGVRRSVFALVGISLLVYAGIDVPELVRKLIENGAG